MSTCLKGTQDSIHAGHRRHYKWPNAVHSRSIASGTVPTLVTPTSEISSLPLIRFRSELSLDGVAQFSAAIFSFVAAVIAALALQEYLKTNELAAYAQLIDRDKAIAILPLEKDRAHVDALWVEVAEADRATPKSLANARLRAILRATNESSDGERRDSAKAQRLSIPEWKNLEDLNQILYSESAFQSADLRKLRDAYTLCELILYLANDAYYAQRSKTVKPDQAETFFGYLDDIGDHPIFLLAVWFGHGGGHMTTDFAQFLRSRLLKNERTVALAKEIFPALLQDSWATAVGTRPHLRRSSGR